MSDQDVKALARRIHQLEEKSAALARSRQLTASSVPITVDGDDGPVTVDVPLATGVSQGVQAAVVSKAALELADAAIAEAATALTTANGKNARRSGVTEPDPPDGGWAPGDEWVVLNADGVPVGVRVWDGGGFVALQMLADSLLIPGENGSIRLADGVVSASVLAADAVDSKTIRGAQIYGGYMEAPVIASSSRLGSGANVLSDPEFASTVNSVWVASGHLGDAPVTQRDTITWDQTWTVPDMLGTKVHMKRNWGRVDADLSVSAAERKTGTTIFPNFGWLNKTARALNNPYTFVSFPKWSLNVGQSSGFTDPTFKHSPARTPSAGVARTTYLTNTAIAPVGAGERWNIRLGFDRVPEHSLPYISSASVEIINAASNAVLFSYVLSREELMAGSINTWWNPSFSGNVKYRVKAVYTSGGTKATRVATPGSYARGSTDGVEHTTAWLGSGGTPKLGYGTFPSPPPADPNRTEVGDLEYNRRFAAQWLLKTAVFAQVEPVKGWRMTERDGLELFNQLGAKTGQIDGESNFLAGRFATAADGQRVEMLGQDVAWYNQFGDRAAGARHDGSALVLESPHVRFGTVNVTYPGDVDWRRLDGWTAGFAHSGSPVEYMIQQNEVIFRGSLSNGTWSGALTQIITLPYRLQPVAAFHHFPVAMNSTVVRTIYPRTDGALFVYGSAASGAAWSFDAVRWKLR